MTRKCSNHNQCWNCGLETCVRKYPPWDLSNAGERSRSPQSKEQRRRYLNRKRDICVAFGVCNWCMKRDASPGKTRCKTCREKLALKHKNRLKDIVRYERTSFGLCYFCGKPVVEGKRVCKEHYEQRLRCIKIANEATKEERERNSKLKKEKYNV